MLHAQRENNYRVNASDKIAGPMLIAAAFCHVVMAPKVYTIKTPKDTRIGPQLASQALWSGAAVWKKIYLFSIHLIFLKIK